MEQVKSAEVEKTNQLDNIKGYITLIFSFNEENSYCTINNFVNTMMTASVQYNNNKPYSTATRYNLEKVVKTNYVPEIVDKKPTDK
jgi:hypothetical protein